MKLSTPLKSRKNKKCIYSSFKCTIIIAMSNIIVTVSYVERISKKYAMNVCRNSRSEAKKVSRRMTSSVFRKDDVSNVLRHLPNFCPIFASPSRIFKRA